MTLKILSLAEQELEFILDTVECDILIPFGYSDNDSHLMHPIICYGSNLVLPCKARSDTIDIIPEYGQMKNLQVKHL
jgi:hypothetical protein